MATSLIIIVLKTLVLGIFWVWDERIRRKRRRLRHTYMADALLSSTKEPALPGVEL